MKILFVNTTVHTGGASIACQRLKHALETRGHEVRLVVRDDKKVINRLRFVWERLCLLLHIPYARVFSIDDGRCGTDITQTADFAWADAVHLHWVNQAMLGINDIARLLQRCQETGKKVVWTMHDIWPATGVCHLPGDCLRWQQGCGDCPLLRRGGEHDLSARTYARKREAYGDVCQRSTNGDAALTFVTVSRYLCETAKLSPLISHHPVVAIPNPLDTEFFSPGPSQRAELRLPAAKKLLLFVAYNINDSNKNLELVRKAVATMDEARRDSLAVVAVGKNATQWKGRFACEVIPFEYVSDRETMRSLYRSCDALVIPSKMDSLPNTVAEAKACGLPVVGSHVGGIPEMVRHEEDGYLFTSEDVVSLCKGLTFVLDHPDGAALSRAAREDAVRQYSEENVARRYEALYLHD